VAALTTDERVSEGAYGASDDTKARGSRNTTPR